MDAKQQILEQVLTSKFDVDSYLKLCTELFNGLEVLSPHNPSEKVWSEYRFNIVSFTNVGKYINGKEKTVILAVELRSGRSIERARSLQRNFVAKLLSGSPYDAAIVAFFSADDERWRLSFVRLDYEFAAGRAKELLTPAKRYSYLVGKGEPCHTAQEQLFPIFRNEAYNPSLDKIEEAFSVERVTDGFFNKYRDKYFDLKKFLDESEIFNEEAQLHHFTSEQFAKKLMGQLAFLYFLQKKGWLGVKVVPHQLNDKQYKNAFFRSKASREVMPKTYSQINSDEYRLRTNTIGELSDEEADVLAGCFKSEPWGSGTKTFIRDLYTKKVGDKYFFDDYLEPLFYEALNHRRGENNYYKRFNCKIPFLNGGLFEPLENYDWHNSKFGIPDELFSNIDTKGEREADGILDIFDRYNFTMNEDEPLEREVAVDPEMLGKIFENLLDAKDRKSKGAFYTPREIVHYMCQESLINYLVNETGAPYEEMKEFIIYGELMRDEDCSKNSTQMHIPKSVYSKLGVIDKALENVKVADPAVGSGAFPLGMLSEIVKARNNITAYFAQQMQSTTDKARIYDQRDPYKLKWQTIKNAIYAVDIEASAVDIAKLRLWLSIVVDENLDPTYEELRYGDNVKQRDPHPLPNLDYNIMCGNSLIDEFEGIKLFDDSILNKNTHDPTGATANWQTTLFSDSMDKSIEDLFKEQDRLFGEDDTNRKRTIKANIDKIIDDIIRAKLQQDGNTVGLAKYEESLKQKTKPYFLWKLEFARVFKEKGGFDIVVGNPPYIGEKGNKSIFDPINATKFGQNFHLGRMDIFYYFFHKGLDIAKRDGILVYITTNYYVTANGAHNLRKDMHDRSKILKLIDFGEFRIFPSALGQHNIITMLQKSTFSDIDTASISYTNTKENIMEQNLYSILEGNDSKTTYINKLVCEVFDGEEYYMRLNENNNCESAIINKIKQNTKKLGLICNVNNGLRSGIDKSKDKLGIFVLTEHELKSIGINPTDIDNELIKKYYKNSDIRPYVVNNSSSLYIIYSGKDTKIDDYPKILNHLTRFRSEIEEKRWGESIPWFSLVRTRNNNIFTSPKIVCPQRSHKNTFGYSDFDWYAGSDVFFITSKGNDKEYPLLYILGLLNSKLFYHWLLTNGKRKGNMLELTATPVSEIPIKTFSLEKQLPIIKIVELIVSNKQLNIDADTSDLESQIDKMVYVLYGLTDEEIKIVEGV